MILISESGNNLRIGNLLVMLDNLMGFTQKYNVRVGFPAAIAKLADIIDAEAFKGHIDLNDCLDASFNAAAKQNFLARLVRITEVAFEEAAQSAAAKSDRAPVEILKGVSVLSLKGIGLIQPEMLLNALKEERTIVLAGSYPFRVAGCETGGAEKAFNNIRKEMIRPEIVDQANRNRAADDNFSIGVHVRQKDYRQWMGGKHYFTPESYANLVSNISELLDIRHHFYIVSDEDVSHAFKGVKTATVVTRDPISDFTRLMSADVIIGPQSTFSASASKLSKSCGINLKSAVIGITSCDEDAAYQIAEKIQRMVA